MLAVLRSHWRESLRGRDSSGNVKDPKVEMSEGFLTVSIIALRYCE